MKYTQIPSTTFEQLTLGAGVLLDEFTPATGAMGNILGATTGGVNFTATPEFTDFGEDIDNCPKNTKELKKLDNWTVTMSGTLVTMTPSMAKNLTALADVSNTTKITPRTTVDTANDFFDLWLVADYSDVNVDGTSPSTAKAGYVAIHMMDALSTGGFQLQTADKEKGQFAFEFTAHFSIDATDTVPFEIYVKAGG